jgi:hypothetical protein
MPIDNNENNGQNSGVQTPKVGTGQLEGNNTAGSVYSYKDLARLSAKSGGHFSAEIKKFIENMKPALEKSSQPIDIIRLDKESYGFDYDFIVMAIKNDKNIYYTLVEFAKTGPTSISPTEYLTKIENARRGIQDGPVVIPGISVNEPVTIAAITELKRKYPTYGEDSIISIDGIVIHEQIDLMDPDVAIAVATEVISSLVVSAIVDSGQYDDRAFIEDLLDLKKPANARNVKGLKFVDTTTTEDTVSITGSYRNTNFIIQTSTQSGHKALIPNDHSGMHLIGETRGKVEPTVFEDVDPRTRETRLNFFPTVVMNTIEAVPPTLGQAVLNIISGMLMGRDRRWVAPLAANCNVPGKNIGVLDKLLIDEKTGKIRPAADLSKLPLEELHHEILRRIEDTPAFALDIPDHDVGSAVVEAFKVAATSGNTAEATAAAQQIIDAANAMTNGKFPKDFLQNGSIFADVAELPMAITTGKDGIDRDSSNIDLLYLLSLKATSKEAAAFYQDLAWKYVASDTGNTQESFELRLDIYAQLEALGLKTRVIGKKIRLYFSAEFISALDRAFFESGIPFSVDTTGVAGLVDRNFGFMTTLRHNAGVNLNSMRARPAGRFGRY